MNILVIGASTRRSVGYLVGEYLRSRGHTVTYASRSGRMGVVCDVTNPLDVKKLISRHKPNVLIIGASSFVPTVRTGAIRDWASVQDFIMAKCFGPIVAANAFVKSRAKGPKFFIALGGREISASDEMMTYTVGNGGLWSAVRFLARYSPIRAYYVDMPPITGSAMFDIYLREKSLTRNSPYRKKERSFIDVARAVDRIIDGRMHKRRMILGSKHSL